jgi:hypothetical protein
LFLRAFLIGFSPILTASGVRKGEAARGGAYSCNYMSLTVYFTSLDYIGITMSLNICPLDPLAFAFKVSFENLLLPENGGDRRKGDGYCRVTKITGSSWDD